MKERFDKVSKVLVKQIEQLSAIATSFSEFAKMPPGKAQLCDLHEELNELINLYSSDEIEIISNYQADEHHISIDPDHLNRILINLIRNADEAAEGKALIEIETRNNENKIFLSLKDNGGGIDPDFKDKIFTPNFSTKTGGMGLGLAMVKKLVEAADGEIHFESEEGVGTTFFISFAFVRPNEVD